MVDDLTYDLMRTLGLEIDDQNRIISMDNPYIPLNMKGKILKASYTKVEPFIGRGDMLFNPVENYKLMSGLFSLFVDMVSETEDRYFNVYYTMTEPDGKVYVEIKENMQKITSRSYNNPSLAYIDLIYKIDGFDVDLTEHDLPEPLFEQNKR